MRSGRYLRLIRTRAALYFPPGNRLTLLRTLKDLVADDRRKIIWISSESGSGKSTVAHALADELRGEGRLAGTFFFSRKYIKRSTFDHVLHTLAYQLGLHHPRAKEIIIKAISDDPALLSSEKSRNDLIEKLIIEPLRQLAVIWKGEVGMSIILDALDEGTSSGLHYIDPFVSLLAHLIRDASLPIYNLIISSRLRDRP
ncbi:hypothetical protein CONPUDRAFT_159953 [Coniophora puteana RWD-64-598 SS2]|uniref:Nephrocystin 3-like N-terminal domain-containing protein n=1 Tax=Coniophora puteana (strain RWD-64-598) TaxID=741705 RepID=R7SEQ4_CONPW|nr:uncharacterized protein CONPUDRAFT_159953 [Coniophora puteana RWD-64-598 SS2]EIW74661.1 hypothetical protein CONPUDRAFT_159953 [Coniophora puteana RWD-64-598 SS2]